MYCRICGHVITRVTDCSLNDDQCDDKKDKREHSHCKEGCWCSYGGCWPED